MSLQALDRMRDPSSLRTRHNCPPRAATHSYNHRARVGYRSALIDTVVGNSGEWNLNDEAAAVRTQNQPLRVAAVPDRTFETWQHLAFHQDAAQNTARSDELQELRETSRRRVEHWPNTIEALRRNKEARRQRRLEEEEQRRCALDEAEAALVAAKRTEQLRHARTLLYETDDRVKTFLSNLRTAAVLEERTMQQDYAVRRKQAEKEREAQWFTAQEEARLRAEREDARNKTERHARALEFQAAQKAQLEEMKRQKISEIRANREEGRRIAAMAQSNAEKERQEERRRKEAALRNMDELMECNAQLQGLRQQERQKEQQEAEKIEAYAHQKQQQQQRRQERMAEKRRVQQATRQAMIDRQTEQLRIIQMEQRDAELKQMRDFEAERNADEQRKADHRAALWKDIVVSREEQLQRKQRQKERLQREAERMKGIWVVRTQDMLREEMHEREETQARAARIRQLQEWQHDEKSRRERAEADQVRHEAQIAAAVRAEEDALFGTYVRTVLEEFPPGSLAHTKGMRSLEGIR